MKQKAKDSYIVIFYWNDKIVLVQCVNYTKGEVLCILKDLAAKGKCVIVVTHSSYVANMADEKIELSKVNKTKYNLAT